VVVVHGFGEHSGRYVHLAEALVARGYGVLAYDQRGHGRSEGARGYVSSFQMLVDDLSLAISQAARSFPGTGQPFLYGHSLGALVVMRHLQTAGAETTGAILSAPWLGTAATIPLWKEALAAVLRRVAPAFPVPTEVAPEELTSDEELQRAYREDPLVGHAISVGLYDAVLDAQQSAMHHGPIATPTLLLVPLEDRVTDVQRTLNWAREAGPAVEVKQLAGMRHEPHNERARGEVLKALADWLDVRTRGTGGG
jgi:alpha-beta hydrolase superfamily lysophospholipase